MGVEFLGNIAGVSSPNELGGKTYWLNKLAMEKYNVAKGFCIHKKIFIDFLYENNINIGSNLNDEIFKYDKIKSLIFNSDFSDSLKKKLKYYYDSMKKPLIVRSSSSIEDSEKYSCAGLFSSIPNINTFEVFLEGIKLCWISSFNELIDMCFPMERDYAITVLVQEQLIGEIGGVAFSINPITGNTNEVVIEYSNEGPAQVVSGSGKIKQVYLSKDIDNDEDEYEFVIKNTILKMEDILGKSVDMEWIISNNKLYILQIRPITTQFANHHKIINVDSNECSFIPLKNLQQKHLRRLEKKKPIALFCMENNISIVRYYYWFRENDPKGMAIDDLLYNKLVSNICEITDGEKNILVHRKDVKSLILRDNNPVLRIGESIKTDYSGFATKINDKYYIEIALGGFNAFYSGEFEITKYVIDEKFEIVKKDERYFEQCYNLKNLKWEKETIPKTLVKLSKEKLKEIIEIIDRLSERFSNIRIEWILSNNQIYFYDATIENSNLITEYGEGKIISAGNCSGKVNKLNNTEIFNEIISHVSVRLNFQDEIIVTEKEQIQKVKETLSLDKDSIIFCKYPNERLVCLLDSAKGFVFERGSLLCHFAIILRENGIPAIINPHLKTKVENGQFVTINNGKLLLD